ncbi:MAG: AAA family ATPase [Clostridia bacterium]|nr:AAA family ATPase [Clostridia bacterium]
MTDKDLAARCGGFDDAMTLCFRGDGERGASHAAGERFLRSAALLTGRGFLGMELSSDPDGNPSAAVFSFPADLAVRDDFDWMFRGCASVSAPEAVSDLTAGGRRLYVLSSVRGAPEDVSLPRGGLELPDGSEDLPNEGRFREMYRMLARERGILRIVAGGSAAEGETHGWIFISLPGLIPLRLESAAAMAFPHTAVLEADAPGAAKGIPDTAVLGGIAQILRLLTDARKEGTGEAGAETEGAHQSAEEDAAVPTDEGTPLTPIETLGLSVRACNCLRRAGITSVEELRTVGDDRLMRMRNLGRKGLEEIRRMIPRPEDPKPSGEATDPMAALDALIGLGPVKEQVHRIAAYAALVRDLRRRGLDRASMTLNMAFVGNPGTAKTTAARLIARVLSELGVIASDGLMEVSRADLVAKYEGQTAAKVKEVFRSARGRMLFIDEAYTLVEDREDGYGDEAIHAIVQEMENAREDTVVVFAGYPDKMEAFLSRNPGLRSRIPFILTFGDYSAEEMAQIAVLEAGKRGFALDDGARSKLRTLCAAAVGRPEMGNGRFSRNLIESAILSYACRVFGADGPGAGDLILTSRDLAIPAGATSERRSSIGFCV